jgi:hypothetical protein
MFLVNDRHVSRYSVNDVVHQCLDRYSQPVDEEFTSQIWLRKDIAKRFIYAHCYGDLFQDKTDLKILDVGGGLSVFTRLYNQRHDYKLIEILAHDSDRLIKNEHPYIFNDDWFKFDFQDQFFDIVIANDIFPNVDQRLELFLEKVLPCTSLLRMSLTYYNDNRFYLTKRLEADEVLTLLAWNSQQLRLVLDKFSSFIISPDMDIFDSETNSVFDNGRQVCCIEFRGQGNV